MEEVKPQKGLKEEPQKPGTTDELLDALLESEAMVLVSNMRIYDVLMCLYADKDPEDAAKLVEEHNNGKIRSSLPWYAE